MIREFEPPRARFDRRSHAHIDPGLASTMHIWTDLLAREGAFLALLSALGAAPVAFLSERFDGAVKLSLAPVLGFCVGTCVATTVLEFAPARETGWMLIPLALLSLGIGAWRTLRRTHSASVKPIRISIRDVVQLIVVCAAVAGPLTYTLHQRHTVGPAAYTYTDVDNYVGETDGAQATSISDARSAWARSERTGSRFADLAQWDWSFFASFNANPNAAPLEANLNELLGLGATDTNSPFLVVLLLAGALGAFAAVRYATRSDTWTAALAGAMFGGPFFLELWFDTFQAAIMALALVMPFVVLGCEAVRSRRGATLVLLALVTATLFSVYPVLAPILLATSALVLAWRAVVNRLGGMSLRSQAQSIAVPVIALVALVLAFDNVGFAHVIGYYHKLLNDEVPLPRVGWHLPVEVLPGWLFQTREFWNMPALGVGGAKQVVTGALLPIAFLGVVFVGLRRYRPALVLVALAGICALVADYSYSSRNACTYCAERDLLPLAPIATVLLALGLAAILAMPQRWARAAGAIVVAAVVIAVGQRAHVELTRFANGSYFLDSANRSVLAHLPSSANAVQLEGYGQTLNGQAEQPLVYYLANERARGRVSIILAANVNNSLEYLDFGVPKQPGPEFHPDYDFVLTRFAAIDAGRRVIARSGPIALEQRIRPFDITPYAGLEAPLARIDPSGTAWVQPGTPLQFYVVGVGGRSVSARLTFRSIEAVEVASQAGLQERRSGDTLVVCVRASGAAPVRRVSLQLNANPVSGPVPSEEFPPPTPAEGIALAAMQASADRCQP